LGDRKGIRPVKRSDTSDLKRSFEDPFEDRLNWRILCKNKPVKRVVIVVKG